MHSECDQRSHADSIWAVILQKRHPRQQAGQQTATRAFQSPPGYLPNKDTRHPSRSYAESPNLSHTGLGYPKIIPKIT